MEAQLVESLLDLSRIAAGKLNLDSERVDLSALLDTVLDSLRPATDTKGLTFDVAAQPGPVVVIGDSNRLQQIFLNLLTNAVQFTSRGGHVQVRLTRIGSKAQIQVIDDGEGVDANFLPHIFDRFRQAESATGLSKRFRLYWPGKVVKASAVWRSVPKRRLSHRVEGDIDPACLPVSRLQRRAPFVSA